MPQILKKGRGWRRGLCRRVVVRFAQGAGKEVLRIDRPNGRRVLKFDGPLARGLWWRLRRKFIKVSVTGLAFYVIWYDKHSADWLAALASLSGYAGLPPQAGAK